MRQSINRRCVVLIIPLLSTCVSLLLVFQCARSSLWAQAPVGAPPTVWLQLQRWCLYAIAAAAPQVVETAQEVEEKTGSRRGSSSSRRQGGGSRGRKEKDEEGGCLMRLLLRCVGV